VKYKDQFYLLWNVNKFGKAQLIDKNGVKFSGTPATNRLKWVDQCPVINYAIRFTKQTVLKEKRFLLL